MYSVMALLAVSWFAGAMLSSYVELSRWTFRDLQVRAVLFN